MVKPGLAFAGMDEKRTFGLQSVILLIDVWQEDWGSCFCSTTTAAAAAAPRTEARAEGDV